MDNSKAILKFLLKEEDDFGDDDLVRDVADEPVDDPYEGWLEKYRPIKNPLAPEGPFDGWMYETYGPEFDRVRRADPTHVWTLLDIEGKDWIVAGFRYVDRMGYFITELPWEDQTLTIELPGVDTEE